MNHWYQLEVAQVLQHFEVDPLSGLSQKEVNQRRWQHGTNELIEHPLKNPWRILWEQLSATPVMMLLVAGVISAILGDYKDAVAILAIVIFNAILGLTQEYRAEKAIAALKKLAVPTVRVCRQGKWQELSACQLVLGDIVYLEAGNSVPADGRVLESTNLRVREAAFTGESFPVEKDPRTCSEKKLPLGDRSNMVYMGTIVAYGRGQVVVTETGMSTELGKIAHLVQTVQREPTPLQRRLDQLGQKLAMASLLLVAIIFTQGLLRGESINLMILTAVSMAVAIIPEGLPAVVTIALALGSRRMLQRHALIRKLPAVETLGSVTTICADKTGTLTENRMSVIVLDVANQRVDLRATPAIAATDGTSEIIQSSSALSLLLMGCALCNNVLPSSNSKASVTLEALGDPTEVALAAASARFGFQKAELNEQFPCVAEMPFASERKRMTTVHPIPSPQFQNLSILDSIWQWGRQGKASHIAFTKGAVDSLLEVCNYVWVKDRAEPLHAEWHDRITTSNSQSAQGGMRVLGVAFRLLEALPANGAAAIEQDLIFIGLIGMIDPPRPEVKTAVQTCSIAGIRPVMITGDHPLMAQYIAQAVGITNNHHVLTGLELSQLSLPELEAQVESVSIYARVSPQQKLNIVKALQNQGHIVAMTGDGINDAPALRKADIGVAMGMAGTDVSKEAADMVLLDDNFATIVAAVEEGRVIYDNIRKFIKYTLTGNAGGVWIMVLAPLLAMPLPLLPLQILWINLMADGLMALALSVEPSESNVMQRSPYSPQENIFGRGVGRGIIWVGFLVGLTILLMGYEYWLAGQPNWQTMVFTTLACSRASLALAMRSEHDSLFRLGLLTNKPILGAAAMTLILQIAVIYTPWLQTLFKTKALSVPELIICLGLSLVGFLGVELEKWIVRRRIALAASEHK